MSPAPADRAPAAVRGCVLVAASVLLGATAHASAGGAGPRVASLLVMAGLLAVTVSTVLATGGWLASRVPRGWSSRFDDAAAAAALVLGQVVAHALAQPLPGGPALLSVDTGHHGAVGAALSSQHALHGGHPGWQMPLAHASAAVVLGLLLRWMESCAFALGAFLAAVRHALCRALAWPLLRPPVPTRLGASAPGTRDDGDGSWPATLETLGTSVVRRGPPTRMAFA